MYFRENEIVATFADEEEAKKYAADNGGTVITTGSGRYGVVNKENFKKKIMRKLESFSESLSSSQLFDIAKRNGLTGDKIDLFIAFVRKRMPEETSASYLGEWAQRFKKGNVFAYADPESKTILKNLGYSESFKEGSYEDFFSDYGSRIGRAVNEFNSMLRDVSRASKKWKSEDKVWDSIDSLVNKLSREYDSYVIDNFDSYVSGSGGSISPRQLAKLAIDNQNRNGTEPQFVIDALEDFTDGMKKIMRKLESFSESFKEYDYVNNEFEPGDRVMTPKGKGHVITLVKNDKIAVEVDSDIKGTSVPDPRVFYLKDVKKL